MHYGNVYLADRFAGILAQQPNGRHTFTYDPGYLDTGACAIAHSLPLQSAPHWHDNDLPPFFDNLVSEGWLAEIQSRALATKSFDRFELLMGFGSDCAGAISVIDHDSPPQLALGGFAPIDIAALSSRASISGVQPKLPVIEEAGQFRPAIYPETATHIAKLPGALPQLIELEWLSTQALRALLPTDDVVQMHIAQITGLAEQALLIRRFDRIVENGHIRKLHFEEFNQLLGKPSDDKYEASYDDMATFIRTTAQCHPAEAERLYRRILACLLIGNTDAHLKNFAMFHTAEGLRLTPSYDIVSSAWYRQFDTVALGIAGARNLKLGRLQPKHLVTLGERFGLDISVIQQAIWDLGNQLDAAKTAISEASTGSPHLREGLVDLMQRRWNGSFASTDLYLVKRKQSPPKDEEAAGEGRRFKSGAETVQWLKS